MWYLIINMLLRGVFKVEKVMDGDDVVLNLNAPEISRPNWPDVWKYITFGNGKYLFWRTDGVFYQFFTWRRQGPKGAYDMGDITTTDGKHFRIRGGWSSRTGVINLMTGLNLVEIKLNGVTTNVDLHHASMLARRAGLKVERDKKYSFPVEDDVYVHPKHSTERTEVCYRFVEA